MAEMKRAMAAQEAWAAAVERVRQCRMRQYNAATEQMNAVTLAWDAQIRLFCARKSMGCAAFR
jgi:hypothetical protein